VGGRIFGGTGKLGHLFVYDPATGESTDLGKPVGEGDYGVWALTVGHDGLIYGGTYKADGQLFAYDPVALELVHTQTAVPGEYYIPSLLTGPDGMIYGGTGGQGHLFVYNPDGGSLSDEGSSMDGGTVLALTAGADGLIYGGTNGGWLFSYNPAGGAIENLGEPPVDPSSVNCLVTGHDGRIYGGTSEWWDGRLFSFEPGTRTFADLGLVQWKDGAVLSLVTTSDGVIYGGTDDPGVLFSYDPADHAYSAAGSCTSMDIVPAIADLGEPGGEAIVALTQGADGRVFWGGASGAYLWAYDPSDGQAERLGQADAGEWYIYSLTTGSDGRIYDGTYPNAHLFVYDPSTDAFTGLGQPVPGERYVYSLASGHDGRIYGGTSPGAHFFVYNPSTGLRDVGQPVAGESGIRSLTTGLDGKIYGGTSATRGHLFVYDPATDHLADLGQAVSGQTWLESLATAPDGSIWGHSCCTGRLFQYDPASGAFSDKGQGVPGRVLGLAVTADGMVYGGTWGWGEIGVLFRYDPPGEAFARLGKAMRDEGSILSLLLHDSGVLYGGTQDGHLFTYDPNLAFTWDTLTYESTVPYHTTLTVDVLDMEDQVLMSDLPSGALVALDSSTYPALRLRANLSTTDGDLTPRLDQWTLRWLAAPVNHPPANGAVIPSSGSGPPGATTIFTTTWTDPDGWQDLKQGYFHIGASPSISGNVTLLYNAAKDRLWLRSDDGSAWTGGCAPESASVLENSQAIVHCDSTTVHGAGDTLTVTWAIESKPGYTGTKKLGLRCKDRSKAKATGAWVGTWTIE
jgi:outer membrane protein assembly factor BamB